MTAPMVLELTAVLEYAACPMRYWWRCRAHIVPPPTASALPERTVRDGLQRFYDTHTLFSSLLGAVTAAWQDLLTEWDCPDGAVKLLTDYAKIEERILRPFLDGSILRRDGTPYQVPRMTRVYKEQAQAAGLGRMRREIARLLQKAPVVFTEKYTPAEALGDAVIMAVRYQGPSRDPFREIRVDYPFRVPVSEGIVLEGKADLAVLEGEKVVQAEIHDYAPRSPLFSALPHHLAVVALAAAEGVGWGGEPILVYRHMPTGRWTKIPPEGAADPSRFLPVLTAAIRGVRCGVFLPRLAVAEYRCVDCPYYGLCITQDGMDVLDDLDATAVTPLPVRRRKGDEGR
ncbi:MAG TPA: hypothetical protein EYP77_08385 [Anaerolineae bacterium]|nr:hypothetical protein [Anaerolineae bacterium]